MIGPSRSAKHTASSLAQRVHASGTSALLHNGDVRRGRDKGRRVGVMDILDGTEIVMYGLGSLALLFFLLFLGVRAAHRLAGPAAAGFAIAAAVLAAVIVVRDRRRRRWSPVSIVAAALYVLCLAALIAADAFLS